MYVSTHIIAQTLYFMRASATQLYLSIITFYFILFCSNRRRSSVVSLLVVEVSIFNSVPSNVEIIFFLSKIQLPVLQEQQQQQELELEH